MVRDSVYFIYIDETVPVIRFTDYCSHWMKTSKNVSNSMILLKSVHCRLDISVPICYLSISPNIIDVSSQFIVYNNQNICMDLHHTIYYYYNVTVLLTIEWFCK